MLITWEEELPELLDTKQNGSHSGAVFNSNGRKGRTTNSHKHKHTWPFVQTNQKKNQPLGRDTLVADDFMFSRISPSEHFIKHATYSPLHGGWHSF